MNQFNKVLTNTGDETSLFTNLMYNIRNQNFNGDNGNGANFLNHKMRSGQKEGIMLKFALYKMDLSGFLKLINHHIFRRFQF